MPGRRGVEWGGCACGGSQCACRTLSGVRITDVASVKRAIAALHARARVPHVLLTSVRLAGDDDRLSVVGSTAAEDAARARVFRVNVPALDCFFSGTGDMFAALMVVRLREAVLAVEGLVDAPAWVSPDEVPPAELPLAKAAVRVLASMHEVLERTKERSDRLMGEYEEMRANGLVDGGPEERRLVESKAAEIDLVRNRRLLFDPEGGMAFRADAI